MSRKLISIFYLVGQPLLLNAISIPVTAYIIRRLGPFGYGQWMVAVSLVATTGFIANLGLQTVFVRAVAQYPERVETALGEQLGLRLLLSGIAGILTVLLCLLLKYPGLVLECVVVTVLGSTMTVMSRALADVLQGLGHFKIFAAANFVSGFVVTLVTAVAVWRGANALGLAAAYLTAPVTSLAILSVIVHRKYCRVHVVWDYARYRSLLHETRTQGAQQFLSTIQERVEQFLLPKMVGIAEFGYFAASSIVPNRLSIVPDSLITVYYPTISRYCDTDAKRATQCVIQLLWVALLVCLPIAILLFYLAPWIAVILFRSKPYICTEIIRVTIWSVPLLAVQYSLSCALQASGKISETARATAWAAILNTGIALALVSRWGLQGACWSWLFRPALISALLLPIFMRQFPSAIRGVPTVPILVSGMLMALPLLFLETQKEAQKRSVGAMCLGVTLALLLYVSCLLLMRVPQKVRLTLSATDESDR